MKNARIDRSAKPLQKMTLNEALLVSVIEKQKRLFLKNEAATLRAKLADFIYRNTEAVGT